MRLGWLLVMVCGPERWGRRGRGRHAVELAVDFAHAQALDAALVGGAGLDCLDAVDNALGLGLVLLEHLAQLLDDGPQVVHVRLLAARGQAVDHGDAVLLCAAAVELRDGRRGRGRGPRARHVGVAGRVEEGVIVHDEGSPATKRSRGARRRVFRGGAAGSVGLIGGWLRASAARRVCAGGAV